MASDIHAEDTYPIERSEAETRRLMFQALFLNPGTRWLLERAGIEPGMKVLDAGSGAGDVALLAAERVGPKGAVIGVDLDPAVLETARERVRRSGGPWTSIPISTLWWVASSCSTNRTPSRFCGRCCATYAPVGMSLFGR
jgi:SAM-dependent methyltransferase